MHRTITHLNEGASPSSSVLMGAEWWSTSNDPVGGAIVREVTMLPTITAVFIFLVFEGATVGQPAMEKPLQLESKIPLGSVAGRIDHMAFDPTNHRLFVAELGNNTVGVVDLDAQKVVHRISGLKEPQGVAYISKNDTLYVANGGNGSVQFFSGEDYSMAGQINLDADADNIRVDFSTNHLLVGYGSGAIGTIDLQSNKKTGAFPLAAHPESFQLDAGTREIFVNLPNQRSIAVIDADTGKQRAAWSLAFGGNFPMALDSETATCLCRF
jgi:YVTN family beta-propeller protein